MFKSNKDLSMNDYIEWTKLILTKESEIDGRYNWRGPPYHMIIHALQTVLHLVKKYSE